MSSTTPPQRAIPDAPWLPSTRQRAVASTDAGVVARRFLDCMRRGAFDELETILAADVWFRVLLPRSLREERNSTAVADAYRGWFSGAIEVPAVDVRHHSMAGREHISYRYRIRPRAAPQAWSLVEQAGYCRIREGRISRLDLVCTGFHPL